VQPVAPAPNFDKTQPFVRSAAAPAAVSDTQFAKTQTFSANDLRAATQGAAPSQDPPAFAKTVAFQAGATAPDFAKTVSFQSKPPAAAAPAPGAAKLKAHNEDDIDLGSVERWRDEHRPPPPPVPVAPPVAPVAAVDADVGVGAESSGIFLGLGDKSPPPAPAQTLGEVLIVDEGEVSRSATQRLLHRNGFHADLASTGQQAVELASARPYRFVFVDEISGAMNAHQVCRAVRKTMGAGGARPTVVILSSRGGAIDKLRAKLAGCDVYLVKPLKLEDVLAVLDRPVPKRGFFG
jgi:CheY-like chemotaxis protein